MISRNRFIALMLASSMLAIIVFVNQKQAIKNVSPDYCWLGITPNQTRHAEVLGKLNNLINSGEIDKSGAWPNTYLISNLTYPNSNKILCRSIRIETNEEQTIDYVRGIYEDIRVEDLISYFGEPEALVFVRPELYDETVPCWNEEPAVTQSGQTLHILYPSKGLRFYVPAQTIPLLCPEVKVITFTLFPPMSLENSLSYLHEINPGSLELSSQDAIPWPGYNPATTERREKKGNDDPVWCNILKHFPRTLPSECSTRRGHSP